MMVKFTRAQLLHVAIVGLTDDKIVAEFAERYGSEACLELATVLQNLQGMDDMDIVGMYHQLFEELKEEMENESTGS